MSGTRQQTSGALFGDGVYFSDDLRVARNFSNVSVVLRFPDSLRFSASQRLSVRRCVIMYHLHCSCTCVCACWQVGRGWERSALGRRLECVLLAELACAPGAVRTAREARRQRRAEGSAGAASSSTPDEMPNCYYVVQVRALIPYLLVCV